MLASISLCDRSLRTCNTHASDVQPVHHTSSSCTPILPPPRGEPLARRGYLKQHAFAGDSQMVASKSECRDLCARHGAHVHKPAEYPEQYGCYIFGYDEASHVCSFYFKSLQAMGFTQSDSSPSVLCSLRCYDCPPPARSRLACGFLTMEASKSAASSTGHGPPVAVTLLLQAATLHMPFGATRTAQLTNSC